jgi:hypothetical protein
MGNDKIKALQSAIGREFPGIEIDFKAEEPYWYRFRIGFSPPALFVDLQYEFVADNAIGQILDRIKEVPLTDLMPSVGTARYQVFADRIEAVDVEEA